MKTFASALILLASTVASGLAHAQEHVDWQPEKTVRQADVGPKALSPGVRPSDYDYGHLTPMARYERVDGRWVRTDPFEAVAPMATPAYEDPGFVSRPTTSTPRIATYALRNGKWVRTDLPTRAPAVRG